MNKVVKCKNSKCAQYFMHTEKATKCPFCHTEYGEVIEKETTKEESTSTKKGAFKIKIVKDKDN